MQSGEMDRLAVLGWRIENHAKLVDDVWRFASTATVHYPDDGFAALAEHAGGSYWFDHRADEVGAALARTTRSRTLWEIGAGSGAMTTRLVAHGFDVVPVEPLEQGARAISAAIGSPALCGTLEDLALPDCSLPAVGMFDVVEHLTDPVMVLREVHRVVAAAGVLVVTVPAYQWLWSDEDDAAGHQVRFTQAKLVRLAKSVGFVPLRLTYMYASLVAPAAVVRALPYRLGRRRTTEGALDALATQLDPSPTVDRAVRAVLRGESAVTTRFRLPFGTSILGVFRRV